MFSKKYLSPLIITLAAVTIGGAALAYNNSRPKNEVAKLTTTSLSSSSLVSKSESSNSASKISSVSSISSTVSQSSSISNSSQTEVKKVPVEVESPVQEKQSETKSNPIQGSQPLTKVTKNIPSNNCTLPDLAGYDVLLTEKGCLYFKQKFEGNNYDWEWSSDFVAKDRTKLTKALQDIAGIQYDKNINQMRNKNAPLEIRGYSDPVNSQKSIAIGFRDPMANIATDWFDYSEYFNMYEDQRGNWSFEVYDPFSNTNTNSSCDLKPTSTTQIIYTKFRCIEFPIDMFKDPNFSWLKSFDPRDEYNLQAAVINATVEFYEANYPNSKVKFPEITIQKQADRKIYFGLIDVPKDCDRCDGNIGKIIEFYQFDDRSWKYGEQGRTARITERQESCKTESGMVSMISVKDDCFMFSERYTCDQSGDKLNRNLKQLILNEAQTLYYEFQPKINSEYFYMGMVCDSIQEPSFDFSLKVGYSGNDTKYIINYKAKFENNTWNIKRFDTSMVITDKF